MSKISKFEDYIDEDTMRNLLHQAEEVGRVVGGLHASVERQKGRRLSTQHSALGTSD